MKWVDKDLENLVYRTVDELVELYPEQTRENLERRKREKTAERLNNHRPASDKDGVLKSTWEMMSKNQDGEPEVTTLHKYEYPTDPEEALIDWQPATPANITPSKRKAVAREYKVLLVFGDTQIDYRRIDEDLIPIHNVPAINAMVQLAKELQPDEIINLGDTLDFSSISRFAKDSDHFFRTLGPSFQYIHDLYAQLRADNPDTKITEVDSNHHKRLTDFVLKFIPDMYGLRRPGETDFPVFTYPYLANLKHVGVNWVGGYGAATYEYKKDLVFIHGEFAVSSGSTAAKLSKANPDRNIVQGHKHSMETHTRTTRDGRYLTAAVAGAMCRLDGVVPSYHSSVNEQGTPVHYQEDWQNGLMVIYDYGDGQYQFDQIPIVDGKITYKGIHYDGASN